MNTKKFFFIIAFCLLFSTSILAQTPTPTPPGKNQDEDVVRITTTLIQIDVTVTDKDGKLVKDLKPEDFEIYENKNQQEITNFSFIEPQTSVKTPASTPTPKANNTSAPIPPARLKVENIKRTLAFVVDDLRLGADSIYFTRKALKNFVDKQMQDSDLVAIVLTSAGTSSLQQFTSDKRRLYAAIESIRWRPSLISGFSPMGPDPLETDSSESNKDLTDAENEYNELRQSVFRTGTLGAVGYVVNGMTELPGRKSIMLVSDSLSLKRQIRETREPDERTIKALRSLIEAANRSSVVIYTMTANGIAFDRRQFTAESNSYLGASSDEDQTAEQKLLESGNTSALDVSEAREGLRRLARETGGLAIINQKELDTNIETMIDDQKGYYLIGYQPDDETFDAKTAHFNQLLVKVKRPGLRVRYRSGFFGITDEKIEQPVTQTPQQRLVNAFKSPFGATGVNLRLNAMFENEPKAGSFIRSLLHIDTKDLKFIDEPDGNKKAVFTVIAYTFGNNGMPVDTINKVYTLRVKSEFYQQLLDKGFVYAINLPVKRPGVYQLRVALRDEQEEKIGAANQFIEVPDLLKNRLTLSGIILQSTTQEQFQKLASGQTPTTDQGKTEEPDPQTDTALRRFHRGNVLQYNYSVYNAKMDKTKHPQLEAQARMFRDGKLVFEGKFAPLDGNKQTEELSTVNGALALSQNMVPGDYVLQVVVKDKLAKDKQQLSSQWIDFEVVK